MRAELLLLLAAARGAQAMLHVGLAIDRASKGASPGHEAHAPALSDVAGDAEKKGKDVSCSAVKSVGGTMYTIEVAIGTPEQKLDVVVDTGSNLLVVESCLCKDRGYCNPFSKCFREESSKTLELLQGPSGPATTVLNFGSGAILTEVASDAVRIGQTRADMKHGVLLMVDQLLNFVGPFEGILGLGLPDSKDSPLALRIAHHSNPLTSSEESSAEQFPATVRMGSDPANMPFMPIPLPAGVPSRYARDWNVSVSAPQVGSAENATRFQDANASLATLVGAGFLRQAGVSRFSLCFGDGPDTSSGVLRFNPPALSDSLKSVGTMHWGIDFRGVSVGNASLPLGFCSAASMASSQQTPCGAIPDSGTTYIMGPQEHLSMLFESICDMWPRCKANYTAMAEAAAAAKSAVISRYTVDPWGIQPLPKSSIFEIVLQDCNSWMSEAAGINDLPPIHFHVADSSGSTKALTLEGWDYVVSVKERERRQVYQQVPGYGDVPVGYQSADQSVWICRPAIGTLDYPTAHNGPAWILGMPLFHQYVVGFDLNAVPPSVSFDKGPCGHCGSGGASLLAADESGAASLPRVPRKLHGSPRLPEVDVRVPF